MNGWAKWGRRDLNPHGQLRPTDFHSPAAFAAAQDCALRIGLSLYPQRDLLGQLPSSLCTFPTYRNSHGKLKNCVKILRVGLGSGLPYLESKT